MQERRLYPRYSFESPVELRSIQGARFDAQSSDISVAGITMRVSRAAVVDLAQGGSILTPGDPLRVVIKQVPETAGRWGMELDCRVKHVRRLSQEEYLVGVWLNETDQSVQTSIASLVEQARQSDTRR